MHFPRLIICVFMSLSLLCGCFNKPQNIAKTDIITENTVNIENNPDYVKNMPVYRCLAARMISIIFGNGGIDSSTEFADVSFDQWYAPYINNVSKEGIMTGSGGLFNPNEPLTFAWKYTHRPKTPLPFFYRAVAARLPFSILGTSYFPLSK